MRILIALALASATFLPAQVPAGGMEQHTHPKPIPSTSLMVMAAGKSSTYSIADLQALPQKTVKVANTHTKTSQTYTGPLLTDVLARSGAELGKPLLHTYIKAQGTDNYWVLYSGIEIDPASHLGDTIVALTLDGQPLTDSGAFMLVATEDTKPQRWVRNLASLTVVKPE